MCLAIPGRITSIEEHKEGYMRMGKVELGGIVKEINLQLVPDAKENDYVLVHVGVAISVVDEEEAKSSLEFLKQMNELDELYNSPEEEPFDKLRMTKDERVKQGDAIILKMMS
ncbi:MAG: HypC/HybG/HupF family hydrogenase formation chaperone [Chitinophagaceae bacterium]|jgi:hydrogenase expression/formation protein HypC|nr:HypC/HybG/HupF family hydrogenase formation chaperone [Chitinophagaceae bacterium]